MKRPSSITPSPKIRSHHPLRLIGPTVDEEGAAGSSPWIYLAIARLPLSDAAHGSLAAYDLVEENVEDGIALYCTRARREGTHKHQTIPLFFAAMEIAREDAGAALAIVQANPLHASLTRGIRGRGPSVQAIARAEARAFTARRRGIHLDVPTSLYLRQAGIPIADARGEVHLSPADVGCLHDTLVAPSATSRQKAG